MGCVNQSERGESPDWRSPLLWYNPCRKLPRFYLSYRVYPKVTFLGPCYMHIYIERERVKSSPSFSNKKRIASACFGHLQLFKEIKRLKFLSRKCCSKVPTISLMTSTCLGWFGIQQAYPSLPSAAESPGQAKVRLMSAYAMYASMNLPIYEYLYICLSL
jgi:hypothetical protein